MIRYPHKRLTTTFAKEVVPGQNQTRFLPKGVREAHHFETVSKKTEGMVGRLIGYARVSTTDQILDLQIDALKAAGVRAEDIYTDRMSGGRSDRPGLKEALAAAAGGDTLVVWKLDRLGRSVSHLAAIVQTLGGRGIGFRSLTEAVDTTTTSGRLLLHVLAAVAEAERSMASDRIRAGMASLRARGRGGRAAPGSVPRSDCAGSRAAWPGSQLAADLADCQGAVRSASGPKHRVAARCFWPLRQPVSQPSHLPLLPSTSRARPSPTLPGSPHSVPTCPLKYTETRACWSLLRPVLGRGRKCGLGIVTRPCR